MKVSLQPLLMCSGVVVRLLAHFMAAVSIVQSHLNFEQPAATSLAKHHTIINH